MWMLKQVVNKLTALI